MNHSITRAVGSASGLGHRGSSCGAMRTGAVCACTFFQRWGSADEPPRSVRSNGELRWSSVHGCGLSHTLQVGASVGMHAGMAAEAATAAAFATARVAASAASHLS